MMVGSFSTLSKVYDRPQAPKSSSKEFVNLTTKLADETSYINYIKPLILARELNAPHVLAIIDTHSEWYYSIHPERYVPALRDRDPVSGEDAIVFEGTACIQYLADRFDKNGDWTGRTAAEKAAVMSWTEYQTAGIGYELGLLFLAW
jgi:glutathione S-transferase